MLLKILSNIFLLNKIMDNDDINDKTRPTSVHEFGLINKIINNDTPSEFKESSLRNSSFAKK